MAGVGFANFFYFMIFVFEFVSVNHLSFVVFVGGVIFIVWS